MLAVNPGTAREETDCAAKERDRPGLLGAHRRIARGRSRGSRGALSHVAAAAGVSVGTVYNHFTSKDHLLDAVAHRLEEDVVAAMAAAAPPDAPLREALPDLVGGVLDVAARSPSLRVLSERAGHDPAPEGEAPLIRGWVAQRVALAQRAGEVADVDAGLVADLGFALLKAAMSHSPPGEPPLHSVPAAQTLLVGRCGFFYRLPDMEGRRVAVTQLERAAAAVAHPVPGR